MLEIWGRANSVNVQKVLWLCDELGLPFQRVEAGGVHGVVDTPEFRAMNPNGRVPLLIDGNLLLWESNSIIRYLALAHGGDGFYPANPADRARMERWLDWSLSTLQPAERTMFWGLIRTPPDKRDAAAIEASRAATESCWRIVDSHLAGRDYLEAGNFTLADIVLGAYAHRWFAMPEIVRPDFANLRAWYGRLLDRPAYHQVVARPLT